MQTAYPKRNRDYYYYYCKWELTNSKPCQVVSARPVDDYVADQLIQAFEPAQVEVSLKATEKVRELSQARESTWQARLKQARFEADLAKERFNLVNPRNRLVADSLEDDWEKRELDFIKLSDEHKAARASLPTPMDVSDQESLLEIARDIPRLWASPMMPQERRKQLLRAVINNVALERSGQTVCVIIRWRTGVETTNRVSLIRLLNHLRTDPRVLAVIREMSLTHTDREIATYLNDNSYKPPKHDAFTGGDINRIRRAHSIPIMMPERSIKDRGNPVNERRADGRYSTTAAARILGLNRGTVAYHCKNGRLDAIQYSTKGVWWILLPEDTATVAKALSTRVRASSRNK